MSAHTLTQHFPNVGSDIRKPQSMAGLEGNEAREFVREHGRFVFSVALRYMGKPDEAEDVTQDVLIRALRKYYSFRGASNPRTWLYRITVNTSITYLRKAKMRAAAITAAALLFPWNRSTQRAADYEWEQSTFMDFFHSCLMQLPEKQREVFALRYFDNLSYDEISKVLGTTVGGLKANYHHATKKLAHMIRESEYYNPSMEENR